MNKTGRLLCAMAALAVTLLAGAASAGAAEGKRKLGEAEGGFRPVAADAVLAVELAESLTPEERAYLGLETPGVFSIAAVPGDLVVVEFFNASCYACALMAPVMEEVWRQVAARPELAARVRFVGIGVGNTPEQARDFHDRYETPFPMLADPEFKTFDALGTVEGTPYLLLVRRHAGASVARAQVGYIPQAGLIVAEIESALADAPPADATPRELAGRGWRSLTPPLSAAELKSRVASAAAAAGVASAKIDEVQLPEGEIFYRAAGADRVLWALIAGRAKVCNVCHDLFFIVLFDGGGRVVDLAPIVLTKYKNVEFDEGDVAFLRSRVVGRLLSPDIVFDPTVDAVSAATMTSALVFDTLRRLGETWAAMVEAGKGKP